MKKALSILKPHHSGQSTPNDGSTSPSSQTHIGRHSLDSSRSSFDRVRGSLDKTRASTDKTRTSTDKSRASTEFAAPQRSSTLSTARLAAHSPIRIIRDKLKRSNSSSDEDGDLLNRDGEPMTRNQQRKHDTAVAKEKHRLDAEKLAAEEKKRQKDAEMRASINETQEQKARYGVLPVNNYAGQFTHVERTNLQDLTEADIGRTVTFRARIHNTRNISAHLTFVALRQQAITIQAVLHEDDIVSQHMIYWVEHLHDECVVRVTGTLQKPAAKQGQVLGSYIHNMELRAHEMHVESQPTESLPFTVQEAEVTQKEADESDRHRVSERSRLNNRIIDLRTSSSQSIFRVQSAVSSLFREFLIGKGFVEIHTPKLQGGATESGASVFKVDYFGRPAFLAQSPQLAKQMCIAGDMKKVFEIGAVFRAENSNTHRHMTEYTGLDIEMAIDEHYHEVLRTIDACLKSIFAGIYQRCRAEIDLLKAQFPHQDLVWLEQTPILPFAEAVSMLNATGWKQENGEPLPLDEDLGTRDEIRLGQLIKEKYNTDYYILDKFPRSARPFYAMPDPNDDKYTNSFDIFVRGQEILSGGQRIHDAAMLLESLERSKIDRAVMDEYINGFEWAAPPHGGGGIGLERLCMLMLQLGDIRHATLFPRDPKSLPKRAVVPQLRHPEASTLHPPWEGTDRAAAKLDLQSLEKLIANYGDASNTSYLEPRMEVWRAPDTGAAIGFMQVNDHAITVGDPLCHPEQFIKTIGNYLRFIKKERSLKPLWVLCGSGVEEVLADKHDWRTFSVAAEQRLDPSNNPASHDRDIQRKIRHSEKEGVKITDYMLGTEIPQETRDKVDARVVDWLQNRKGKQVHLTDIHPWQDMAHRQYHFATDPTGKIVALTIMAQLAPRYGWQVKYSLDFPDAPSGAIEHVVMHALKAVADAGTTSITFGGGATAKLTPGHNLRGTRIKVLSKAYAAVASERKLTNKSEFREKLGAQEDPIFVCYPPHGLGASGVRAILNFFED